MGYMCNCATVQLFLLFVKSFARNSNFFSSVALLIFFSASTSIVAWIILRPFLKVVLKPIHK